jgi:hypothetical protein
LALLFVYTLALFVSWLTSLCTLAVLVFPLISGNRGLFLHFCLFLQLPVVLWFCSSPLFVSSANQWYSGFVSSVTSCTISRLVSLARLLYSSFVLKSCTLALLVSSADS